MKQTKLSKSEKIDELSKTKYKVLHRFVVNWSADKKDAKLAGYVIHNPGDTITAGDFAPLADWGNLEEPKNVSREQFTAEFLVKMTGKAK